MEKILKKKKYKKNIILTKVIKININNNKYQ